MVGTVSAGKTSYLVALWHILSSSSRESAVRFDALPDVRDRLNELETAFLHCETIPRTRRSGMHAAELGVVQVSGRPPAALIVPDRAGEEFVDQWVTRTVSTSYANAIREAEGILLFINPQHLYPGPTIQAVTTEIEGELSDDVQTSEPDDVGTQPRDASKSPTQVILVELLQFIAAVRNDSPVRLSVMMSAWDLMMRTEGPTPRQWFDHDVAFVSQYLTANRSFWNAALYGVSALGGDPVTQKQELLDYAKSADRPFILDENGQKLDDFTLPIARLLS